MNAAKPTVCPRLKPETAACHQQRGAATQEPPPRILYNWPGSLCFTRAIQYVKTCPMFPHLLVSRRTSLDSPIFLAWPFLDPSPSWLSFPRCWVASNTKTWYPDWMKLQMWPDPMPMGGPSHFPWSAQHLTGALAFVVTTMRYWLVLTLAKDLSRYELSLSQGFLILHSCNWFFEPKQRNLSLLNFSL